MPLNVANRRVLVFGDSLSADASTPGGQLGRGLEAAGAAAVRVNGKVSRSAVNFFAGNNGEVGTVVLAGEVAWRPDVVIVVLGTNDLGMGATADAAAFTRIRDAFAKAGAEVWAVGPPAFARADLAAKVPLVYATLQKVFGAGRVVDFRPLTADVSRTPDGVHFTRAAAKLVGARLTKTLLGAAPTPAATVTSAAPPTTMPSWFRWTAGALLGAGALVGLAVVIRRRQQLSGEVQPSRLGRLGAPVIERRFESVLTPEEIADWGLTKEEACGNPSWHVTDEDEIIGVELVEKGDPTRYALAHPSTTGARWQVTWFDKYGAGGDVRRATLEDALNDGAEAITYDVVTIHTRPPGSPRARRRG